MSYYKTLFQRDANCILTAFHRLNGFFTDNTEMCCRDHEKDFSAKHNTLIRDYDDKKHEPWGVLLMIQENIGDIARNERYQKHLILQFQNKTRSMSCSELVLYCESILMDFHKTDECSEYMTLALKLKLFVYGYIGYGYYTEPPTTVMEVMVDILDYIAFKKFRYELFFTCIDMFTLDYGLKREDQDPLQPVLSRVLDAAHRLRLNFFNPRFQSCNNPLVNMANRKYVQLSLFHNVRRFLVFAMYGYEDVFYSDASGYYRGMSFMRDQFSLDCDDFKIFNRSERWYRPLQVLILYEKAIKDEGKCKELCAEALYVLWESIVDPYMTEEYFLSTFVRIRHLPVYTEAWKWYSRIVLWNAKPSHASSPRSLKHLARITIRRTLTECVQLPFGVEFLDIPQILKKYLCLE